MRIKKFLIGYFMIAFISGIALSVWRMILMVRYYDPYNNEYALEATGSLKSLGIVLFIVFVILATVAPVLRRFEFQTFSASDHQSSVFTSALVGFVFLASGVFATFYLKPILENSVSPLYKYAQTVSYSLLFLCAVFFIINASGHPRFNNLKKLLSLVTPIWGVAFLIGSYLDPAYNYKDYNHTLCNVAICALILFFLYDAQMLVTGKATCAYFVFSLISLTASMVYMIPTFVLLAYWELSSNIGYIFEAVLLATIFYTCTSIRNLCKAVKEKEKPEIQPEATEMSA